jgi:hypothetical protein
MCNTVYICILRLFIAVEIGKRQVVGLCEHGYEPLGSIFRGVLD